MAKHTQTIRWQFANELFECVDHFVGLALKDLSVYKLIIDSFIKYSQRESFRNFILLLG